jgi:hypothetical protein
MYQDHYDPHVPIRHDKPVHHSGIQARIQDYPAECLWAQLQWAREEVDRGVREAGDKYLANLETEWSRRDLCSRCLRELDHPFMIEVAGLRHAAEVKEGKLVRMRGALGLTGEADLRAKLSEIMDGPE